MCNSPQANCISGAYVSVGKAMFVFIVVVPSHARHGFDRCLRLHVDAVILFK